MIDPKVKVYQSDILRPEFIAELQAEARQYDIIQKAKSKKEWLFGDTVNAEWERDSDVRAEISKEEFYMECSRTINAVLPFPIVGNSGQTLRRWCNVTATFVNVPAIAEFKETLAFDFFYEARRMSRKPEIYGTDPPAVRLALAYKNKWTSDEMVYHYSPKEPAHEYDKVTSWLDQMRAVKWENVIRDPVDRKEAEAHLLAVQVLIEKWKDKPVKVNG